MDRRYRTIAVTLDEAVSFEEAQAMVQAIRMLRGVDDVRLVEVGVPMPRTVPRAHPAVFEP